MLIGYARVSTREQHLTLQQDALQAAGCEKIFVDEISGTIASRPGLDKLKEQLRRGDTLVVWRLDRLGRSIRDLIDWVMKLEQEGVGFQSLQESIDTTTSNGKLVFHLFAALAEFERNLIAERTRAGLEAARARGRKGGRPESLDAQKRKLLIDLYEQKKTPINTLCEMMQISKPTLYAYLKKDR
jgi:DNA invertase Pin-like site-specific DNA recombinase